MPLGLPCLLSTMLWFGTAFMESPARDVYIGNADFENVVASAAYIDKTKFLQDFMTLPKHVVVAGPRCFSKSTNLNMLKYFLEQESDKNKTVQDPRKSKKLRIFRKQAIFQDQAFFWQHFARYPIIHLDLAINVTNSKFFLKIFRDRCIIPLTKQFAYIFDSPKIAPRTLAKIKPKFSEDFQWTKLSLSGFTSELSKLLHTYHDQKPILLIDNYDSPVISAVFSKSISVSGTADIIDFLESFFADITSHNFKRAFLIGHTRIGALQPKAGNKLSPVTIFDPSELHTAFGFLAPDLDVFKGRFGLTPEFVKNITSFYSGYCVFDDGFQPQICPKKIYNMYSVLQYLSTRKLDDGWANLVSVEIRAFQPFLSTESEVAKKFKKCSLTNCSIDAGKQLEKKDLLKMKKALLSLDFNFDGEDLIARFFLESGFYTVLATDGRRLTIAPPNEGVRSHLKRLFLEGKGRDSDEK